MSKWLAALVVALLIFVTPATYAGDLEVYRDDPVPPITIYGLGGTAMAEPDLFLVFPLNGGDENTLAIAGATTFEEALDRLDIASSTTNASVLAIPWVGDAPDACLACGGCSFDAFRLKAKEACGNRRLCDLRVSGNGSTASFRCCDNSDWQRAVCCCR